MKINEIIRKCRKEKELTQEQIANYLGVTAPAVNKWENGISYPDITLLAPLARILDTDINTLLSFNEELTDLEVAGFCNELSEEVMSKGYAKAFEMANKKIKEFPGNKTLALYCALIMNTHQINDEALQMDKYKKQIISWLNIAAHSEDSSISHMALTSLCQEYITANKYEEAQQLLDQIPPLGVDKRAFQANLCKARGDTKTAYQIHEEMIFAKLTNAVSGMMQLIDLYIEDGCLETANKIADITYNISKAAGLSDFVCYSAKLEISLSEKDVSKSLSLLETIVNTIETNLTITEKFLYSHMNWKKETSQYPQKKIIKCAFENDENLDFLRDNAKFKRIMEMLDS